jgi:hypothetical protein
LITLTVFFINERFGDVRLVASALSRLRQTLLVRDLIC